MRLRELIEDISYRLVGNAAFDGDIETVTTDPCRASAESLFVCTRTPLRDGHGDAFTAYANGCRAFLTERSVPVGEDATVLLTEDTAACLGELAAKCYGYPARHMTVLGVTGSAGKSSVLSLAAALLRRRGECVATVGSDGITVGRTRRPRSLTVPDAAALQLILRELAEQGVTVVLLELSTYMLAQKSHFSIPFTAVLLTEQNKCMEHTYRENDEFRHYQASLFTGDTPIWILPAELKDFPVHRGVRVLTFGDGGELTAEHLVDKDTEKGFSCRVAIKLDDTEKQEITLPVPGDFAVRNCLAAMALARASGMDGKALLQMMPHILPQGHLECLACHEGRYIYTDAGFSPAALERVLRLLRRRTAGKLTVLLGSVGGRTYERRAPLGRVATAMADLAYFTADDPDFEDPAEICEQMKAEADPDRYVILPDRERAIRRAVLEMRPGDTLLLFGKGTERHQLIDGVCHPFDEKEIVEEALQML